MKVSEHFINYHKTFILKTIFCVAGMARSNANVAIKTRLKEGVEKSAPTFGRPLGDVAVDEGIETFHILSHNFYVNKNQMQITDLFF